MSRATELRRKRDDLASLYWELVRQQSVVRDEIAAVLAEISALDREIDAADREEGRS